MLRVYRRRLFSSTAVPTRPRPLNDISKFGDARLVSLTVNDKPIQVPHTATVMQACAEAGVDVPRFCYHERLGVAGNCRMCLVQVNMGAKLTASCAAPVMPDMHIATDSAPVKKAREGVMEFLLANHPLDCPICDQGGECDLQDQAMAFGSDRSRFQIERQDKRAVEDKDFGPLVKTSMNRCIHCTRCVRFANEIAGMEQLGTSGRGNDMQIGTYVERTLLESPLSGNLIDLCPVGALTSKPYAFTARPWELRHTDSIDAMDALGANIRVDSRGMEVMRILPRLNEQINEEWLADKSRFACDGLRQQRLVQPLRRDGSDYVPVSWEEALQRVAEQMQSTPASQMAGVAGRFADLESVFALQMLLERLGAVFAEDGVGRLLIEGSTLSSRLPAMLVKELRLTSGIAQVEAADSILLVGCNPLKDAPLLNARIRKSWLRRPVDIGLIGPPSELTYAYEHLGSDHRALERLLNDSALAERFLAGEGRRRPMLLVGQDALLRHPDAHQTMSLIIQLAQRHAPSLFQRSGKGDSWSGLSMLPKTAGYTGAAMLGCPPMALMSGLKLIYLLGADEAPDLPAIRQNNPEALIVYQGHHGDAGAQLADIILPGAAYTEKDATFVNMEGRAQRTRAAVPPPGEAREDWSIIRALSEFAQITLPFDSLEQVRLAILHHHPNFAPLGQIPPSNLDQAILDAGRQPSTGAAVTTTAVPYGEEADYYLTDCISRNSPTMAKCSLAFTSKTVRDQEVLDAL